MTVGSLAEETPNTLACVFEFEQPGEKLKLMEFEVRHWITNNEAGLGHVSEVADGDAPYTPRGCPFQAWSVGELLRIEKVLLASTKAPE